MGIVDVEGLGRSFWVPKHREGLWGGLRGLVSRAGRTVEAVRDVTFSVAPGEFVGVVGPNGAGKSTTLKMLTGILLPSRGTVTVCGCTPHRDRTRLAHQLGVVFGQRTLLWWDLSPAEGFELLRVMYGVDRAVHAARLAELRERLQLWAFLDVPVRKLSLGQKMCCDLAGRCCTRRRCSCSTSRPSGSTSPSRMRCTPSCASATRGRAPRCCSRRTTSTTSRRCAGGC
ncbi:MAG: ATP-binding cassette domain-containing protein [Myxococcota bacterium]